MIKNNFFFEWYESNDNKIKTSKKLKWYIRFILWILVISFFVWCLFSLYTPFNQYGLEIFIENFRQFFSFSQNPNYPSYDLFGLSWLLIWITLQYTLVGTFLGFILALLTAYLSSQTLHKKNFYLFFKVGLVILKAVPILIFFFAFQRSFQKDLAAMIIIFWFTWLWVHKYLVDMIDSVNLQGYYISIKKGNSKFISFWKEIMPRINNKVFSLFLYSLESNITWTTLLASIGLVGIGEIIYQTYTDPQVGLKSLGIPILSLLIVIIFFEFLIFNFNYFILKQKSKKNLKNPDLTFSKLTKILFLFFLVILVIYFITQINWDFSEIHHINNFFYQIFNPSWYLFTNSSFEENPILMLFSLLQQSFVVIGFIIIFGFISGIYFNEKINKFYLSWFWKIFTSLIRIIPSIIFIFIFAPIVNSPHYLLICLIIAINSSALVAKQVSEIINRVNMNTYNYFKKIGWSKTKIIRDFIFPSIRIEFWKIIWFRYENALRSLVFLGLYGGSTIGIKISIYTNSTSPSYNLNSFAAIALVLFILFLTVEFISWIRWDKIYNFWTRKLLH